MQIRLSFHLTRLPFQYITLLSIPKPFLSPFPPLFPAQLIHAIHTHTHTQLYKFVPSLLFFSLIFTFDTKFYLDLLLVELQSQDFPIYSYARIQSKSLSIDIFAKRFHLEIFIYKHASSNENLLENYIFCINVKPLCQTSIGERCHYEMAAFKAGEFVETTARPKAFRGIYIYIYIATIFTAIHVMISDVT